MADEMNGEREAFSCCNTWFASLPEGRQAILREDKWMLAHAAFEAGRASLAANAGSEPVKRVFLVHTGEEHEGEATYTRHDDAPPPLCDSECLYTHPSPPEGMVMVPRAPTPAMKLAAQKADMDHQPHSEWVLYEWPDIERIWRAMVNAAPPIPASEAKGEGNG